MEKCHVNYFIHLDNVNVTAKEILKQFWSDKKLKFKAMTFMAYWLMINDCIVLEKLSEFS